MFVSVISLSNTQYNFNTENLHTIQDSNLNTHLTVEHISVWSKMFSPNPSNILPPSTQNTSTLCKLFVKWNNRELKIYCCENKSLVV